MTLREQLRSRSRLIGCFQSISAPESAEAAAVVGFDFVVVDLEHALIGDDTLGAILRGADAAGIATIVRPPEVDAPRIGKLLDAGAAGIMVPHVRSADEARQIVDATRYPPDGTRGAAGGRATGYWRRTQASELVGPDAPHPAVIAMVEDRAGLEAADEIASVDGIDALFVGTMDLSMDLGVPGEPGHADVLAGAARVYEVSEAHDISAGVPVATGGQGRGALESGATFVATGDMYALIGGLERFVADL